ncbi:MAG: S8 family peptidase [Bacteroidota bacterium]
MKAIGFLILILFWSFPLLAQNYVPDEFIVEYRSIASLADQQAARDLYGITDYAPLSQGVELWRGIDFPLSVTENGLTTVINDVEELIEYIIEVQEIDDGNSNNATASIGSGDPNFQTFLDASDLINENGTFDPLPLCDDSHNARLIGPDQSSNPEQSRVKIIIVDQIVPGIPNVDLESAPTVLGGLHGIKVHSVISNILDQAGLTQVEYISLPIFDDSGVGTSAALIETATFIQDQLAQGIWSTEDIIIVNFSANVVMPVDLSNIHTKPILQKRWESIYLHRVELTNNLLIVSAAGNQMLTVTNNNIFPACSSFELEITVAGTQSCFSESWVNTNTDPVNFEVAAEAANVLTFDGANYYLSSGTSFAAAEVTAVIAQLAAMQLFTDRRGNARFLKDQFLQNTPTNPALTSAVQYGRVLDISGNAGAPPQGGGFFLQSTTPAPSLTLQTTPNPFSQNAIVNIGVEVGQSPHLSLYNSIGQLVHQEVIPNQQELTELQWYTPDQLVRGTYLLRVQVGDKVEQQMIVKQ